MKYAIENVVETTKEFFEHRYNWAKNDAEHYKDADYYKEKVNNYTKEYFILDNISKDEDWWRCVDKDKKIYIFDRCCSSYILKFDENGNVSNINYIYEVHDFKTLPDKNIAVFGGCDDVLIIDLDTADTITTFRI